MKDDQILFFDLMLQCFNPEETAMRWSEVWRSRKTRHAVKCIRGESSAPESVLFIHICTSMKIQPKGNSKAAAQYCTSRWYRGCSFSAVGQDALALPIMQLICILCRTLTRKKAHETTLTSLWPHRGWFVRLPVIPPAPRVVLLISNAGKPSLMCKTGGLLL